ncbi:proline racemase family protein [Pendulispora albinea]|uniref:Proline racemase family protein n=1 Tax=Pendulispora albinea TaxID=2741071 RepID=A0ABZ2M6C0_9BACT
MTYSRIKVVDSHTGGEPTRVILEGGPSLGTGSLADRVRIFRRELDRFRTAIVCEPRGPECMIGALLCEPTAADCATGVIFFDNAGYLGMCGHGTIGLMVTLAHLGRIGPGLHRIETPVGIVSVRLHDDGRVSIANVPSYRLATKVGVDVPGYGRVMGDVAWGGNWFFLIENRGVALELAHVEALTDFTWKVRQALNAAGITGANGAEIDHIELYESTPGQRARGCRNFVLCPGKAYDRSPCGTGTSAKLACLYADGELAPGEVWLQRSVTGSVFEARFQIDPAGGGRIVPEITGSAYVTGEGTLILDERDPLRWGFGAGAGFGDAAAAP